VKANLGEDEAQIFDVHLMVLEDRALITETEREIQTSGKNVEACFNTVSQRYITAFSNIEDEYLSERASDIRDVASRVLHALLGKTSETLSEHLGRHVVIADDISPSDAASLDRSAALGLVAASGSKTSHAVIVARSTKIPSVVGVHGVLDQGKSDEDVLIYGYDGGLTIYSSAEAVKAYCTQWVEKEECDQWLAAAVHEP